MLFEDVFSNVLLVFFSYACVLALIVVSGEMDKTLLVSRKSARSLAWTARSLVVNPRCSLILKSLF